ncbi:hypothetical protein DFH08DRAFT_1082955 [Mycena albidolilacea]|uniref:Uncharacterized protein n=1 Tax=Mycena albidolilacea TaxID=1033008 RepID=A0AAD6ZSH0_9AGAR|nr:hypothetical protein DFH08DRAFT_1082955 [Mycena albidolilacea]
MLTFTAEAGTALAFLIGYLAVFAWMLFAYLTDLIKWRSRYSLIFFHVIVRIASQGLGIAFGVLGFSNTSVFLAFLILGAEGYFSLVLCAFRFLVSWQQHNLVSGTSWLEPRETPASAGPKSNRSRKLLVFIFLGPFALLVYRNNPMVAIHSILVLANVAIIVGGSYLAGADDYTDLASHDTQERLLVSKITRTAGQGVFLACNAILLFAILQTILTGLRHGDRRSQKRRMGPRVHPTLILILLAWFPLTVRGTFSILQSAIFQLSYFNPDNYTATGFKPSFTVVEYGLGVLPEFLTCVLLNLTYFTSRNDPPRHVSSQHERTDSLELHTGSFLV